MVFYFVCVKPWPEVFPAGNYMFTVNRNTWTRREICSKLTIKTPERRHFVLVVLLLNVNTYLLREIDAFFSQHFLTTLQDEGLCYVRFGPLFIMQLRIASKTVMEAFITCQLICKISRKTNISYPMIRVRVSGGKKCYFFGKFCKSICCFLHEW